MSSNLTPEFFHHLFVITNLAAGDINRFEADDRFMEWWTERNISETGASVTCLNLAAD